jgi:hypothetical protein
MKQNIVDVKQPYRLPTRHAFPCRVATGRIKRIIGDPVRLAYHPASHVEHHEQQHSHVEATRRGGPKVHVAPHSLAGDPNSRADFHMSHDSAGVNILVFSTKYFPSLAPNDDAPPRSGSVGPLHVQLPASKTVHSPALPLLIPSTLLPSSKMVIERTDWPAGSVMYRIS